MTSSTAPPNKSLAAARAILTNQSPAAKVITEFLEHTLARAIEQAKREIIQSHAPPPRRLNTTTDIWGIIHHDGK